VSSPTPSERYPGPWQDIDRYVIHTLANNESKIGSLCATAKMRPAMRGEFGEYLVYCAYKNNWRAFVVFPALNEIISLADLIPDIPLPVTIEKKKN
jgi:hypothetical protein